MLVGLVSDTHGLLRPQALTHLKDCQLIVHAGDVGKAEILSLLMRVAPVVAVRGNIDKNPPLSLLPISAEANAGSRRIHVLHNIADIDLDPASAGIDVVVFGHSHKQESYSRHGVLYINPGSAGLRRFRLPLGLALLETEADPIAVEFLQLN